MPDNYNPVLKHQRCRWKTLVVDERRIEKWKPVYITMVADEYDCVSLRLAYKNGEFVEAGWLLSLTPSGLYLHQGIEATLQGLLLDNNQSIAHSGEF